MRRLFRTLTCSILIFAFAFNSYAGQISILDKDGNVSGSVDSSSIQGSEDKGYSISGSSGENSNCNYISGTATAKGDTGPAGGEGGSSSGASGATTETVNNNKTGTATTDQNTTTSSSSTKQDKVHSTEKDTLLNKVQGTMSGGKYWEVITKNEENGNNKTNPNNNDQPKNELEADQNKAMEKEVDKATTSPMLKDAVKGNDIQKVQNTNGVVTIVAENRQPGCENDCPPNNNGENKKVTGRQNEDGSSILVESNGTKNPYDIMKEHMSAVDKIKDKDSSVTQVTNKKENGVLKTTYKIEEDGEEKEVTKWSEGKGELYEIENLYYSWHALAIDNREEFGDTGSWHLDEHTPVGAKKHVFQYTFTHWGNYKVKCVWHYKKHWYHWEYYESCDDDGCTTYEEKVYDGTTTHADLVNTWDLQVPLVCAGCPPVKICVGAGCENDCASNPNYVCDTQHNPQSKVKTDTYTELVK